MNRCDLHSVSLLVSDSSEKKKNNERMNFYANIPLNKPKLQHVFDIPRVPTKQPAKVKAILL